jgi:hypothetical protein
MNLHLSQLHLYQLLQAALLTILLLAPANADELAGKQWPANQQVSIEDISHESFDALLQKYVNENGMVDYRAWHKNQTDRDTLKSYLENLSKANPNAKAADAAKLAFWINAYNALTIEGILRVYPTTSIRNHTAKLFGYNIWKNLHLYSGNSRINLDDIEHKVLRKMNEPRIHFAIVCASIGCPRLLNKAYTADQLENQLVTNTTDFFSRSQNLQVDVKNSKLNLSEIMNWFGSDFGDSTTKQIKTIAPYFPENTKTLVSKGKFSVGYLDYNWQLNAQK